jgi:hypothetical protein
MIDWKTVARARGLNIPDETLDGIAPSLDALEAAFRPLVSRLRYDVEPATILAEAAVEAGADGE